MAGPGPGGHTTPWVLKPYRKSKREHQEGASASPQLRILCFPPAGTGGSIFHAWDPIIQRIAQEGGFGEQIERVELLPIELPGRNSRFKEACLRHIEDVVEHAGEALRPYYRKEEDIPFVILGHSFGGWIAFELTRWIERNDRLKNPVCLIVSGIRSPRLAGVEHDIDTTAMHTLSSEEFWKKMEERYGANPELENPAVRRMMLPILQADFSVSETYQPDMNACEVSCPLFVSGATEDCRYTEDMLKNWQCCCTYGMHPDGEVGGQDTIMWRMRMFPGGHSYLFKESESMRSYLNFVAESIKGSLARCMMVESRSDHQAVDVPGIDSPSVSETGATVASSGSHVVGTRSLPYPTTMKADRNEEHMAPIEPSTTGGGRTSGTVGGFEEEDGNADGHCRCF